MALDLLSIPAMSAKAERIFSQCGNIVRPNRARLKGDTLAAVICLKQWDSEGVIDWTEASTDGQFLVPPSPPLGTLSEGILGSGDWETG